MYQGSDDDWPQACPLKRTEYTIGSTSDQSVVPHSLSRVTMRLVIRSSMVSVKIVHPRSIVRGLDRQKGSGCSGEVGEGITVCWRVCRLFVD